MEVYCIMKIRDYEYGCREIESIWSTYESAESHVNELGQEEIIFWDDSVESLYTIECHQVHRSKGGDAAL